MDDVIYGALAIPYKKANDNYEFLLLKHAKGFWTFPGGGRDEGDASLEDTLIRELREEIGVIVDKNSLKNTNLINKFIYDSNKPERAGKNGETHFYLLQMSGKENLSSWDKIIDHGWFSKEKVLELLPYKDEQDIFKTVITQFLK